MKSGGNLLFRPIGILPFVEASLELKKQKEIESFAEVFKYFKDIELNLNKKPWRNSIWESSSGKMRSSINKIFVKDMLLFLINPILLDSKKTIKLKETYTSYISYDGDLESITLEELIKK